MLNERALSKFQVINAPGVAAIRAEVFLPFLMMSIRSLRYPPNHTTRGQARCASRIDYSGELSLMLVERTNRRFRTHQSR